MLTRGNTLKHAVLLLGGPNTYLPFLQDCWRLRIPQIWAERGYDYPKDIPIEELVFVPENAQYYAAFGAVLYGLHEDGDRRLAQGRRASLTSTSPPAARRASARPRARRSRRTQQELDDFRELYKIPKFEPGEVRAGPEVVRGVIGLDGGSTSSQGRARRLRDGKILGKAYQLSKGNPIQDTKELLAQLADVRHRSGRRARGHGLRRDRLRGRRARGVRARAT